MRLTAFSLALLLPALPSCTKDAAAFYESAEPEEAVWTAQEQAMNTAMLKAMKTLSPLQDLSHKDLQRLQSSDDPLRDLAETGLVDMDAFERHALDFAHAFRDARVLGISDEEIFSKIGSTEKERLRQLEEARTATTIEREKSLPCYNAWEASRLANAFSVVACMSGTYSDHSNVFDCVIDYLVSSWLSTMQFYDCLSNTYP